ncbi:MAG: glucose 1-dehydrogenase [Proteobacteria bacterium]|jgi:NAD(P)-dependent dehydrogenase (short-subunit alcohol dehydrogenase family)|nr:MAG: glucose 1-dehydrogenase [Pseudomonadota bacterium]|tara:strand:+ start:6598 stop:7383 length:786 start_codon:yes stop_codon:yes gene_type:complete
MQRYAGKNVLISGGGSGIGHAICLRLAAEGANIILIDKDLKEGQSVEQELKLQNTKVLFVQADITSEADVEKVHKEATLFFGTIDVLVNNAGAAFAENYAMTTLENWNQDIALNLTGHYMLTRLFLPDMEAQGKGAITNISSVNGAQSFGNPAYSAAKAGVISFTQTLAIEYGPKGIRANVVLPGTIETPVWQTRKDSRPEVFELVKGWYPVGRVGRPEDIAAAVAFLSADEASFVNGASLNVDGGLTAGNFRMIKDITGE